VISSEGAIRKCTCDLDSEKNYFGILGDNAGIDYNKMELWLSRKILKDSKCYYCKRRPICHQRSCIKSTDCPFNFLFMDDMIEILSNNIQYCKKITEGIYA